MRYIRGMAARPRVALLIEMSNGYARELLYGIRAYLREHSPWTIHLAEHGRGGLPPAWLRGWTGDGIIARVENRRIADALHATGRPVVDVSAALPEPEFPRVATDSQAVTRLAAEHLLERGFRHFGYCGDDRFEWSNRRAGFFGAELRARGHACAVFAPRRGTRPGPAWEAELDDIAGWIRGLARPVGIMACYDIRGQQVLEACRRLGVGVPDEVAVMGVHNDDLLCDLCDPPLTSVVPDARRAGYTAATLLTRLMRGERVPAQAVAIEPIGVATRQSTDVVAVADRQVSAAVRYLREHACENISVGDLLKAVPMSRSALERRFKQWLGRTPHDQLLRVKIDRVKTMLATTDLPLAVVAERTGFEHTEYLSVVFKRVTGLRPSAYRARHRVS